MKLLLDMNLSPRWVNYLRSRGLEVQHWSTVGDKRATDQTIFEWAQVSGSVVVTADLDFGEMVVRTNSRFPSVVLVRTDGTLPSDIGETLTRSLQSCTSALEAGALVVINDFGERIRPLPYRSDT